MMRIHAVDTSNLGLLLLITVLLLPCTAAGQTLQWHTLVDGPAASHDWGRDVAVGPDGSVFVAGFVTGTSQATNIWLGKYSAQGQLLWQRVKPNGNGGFSDQGTGVAVGPSGEVYLSGLANDGQGRTLWLRKYSGEGAALWTREQGSFEHQGGGMDVAVAASGRVHVTGFMDTGYYTSNDLWLGTYSPAGSLIWKRTYNYKQFRQDEGEGVAVAPSGAVYTLVHTAKEDDVINLGRAWIRKYSRSGEKLWHRACPTPADEDSFGRHIDVGPDGCVYVAYTNPGGVLAKFTPQGALVWQMPIDDALGMEIGMKVSKDNLIYLAHNPRGYRDRPWLKIVNQDRVVVWSALFPLTCSMPTVFGVDLAEDGSIYIVGQAAATDTGKTDNDILLVKYK